MDTAGDLLRDLAVTADPAVANRYRSVMSDRWNVIYAFGGVTMAAAASAARTHVADPRYALRSATASFLAPMTAGPLRYDVRTLRAGKGSRQLTVDVASEAKGAADEGRSDLHLMAIFAPDQPIDTRFTDPVPPEVPDPEDIRYEVPADYPVHRLNYHRSVEVKTAMGHLPWDPDFEPGEAKWAGWFRFRNTPRLPNGELDPLGYIPAADILGPAMLQKRGPTAEPMLVVSLELSVHFLANTRSEWLLQQSEVFQAADGYVSGMVHLWDRDRNLVATGIHRALMRPIDLKVLTGGRA